MRMASPSRKAAFRKRASFWRNALVAGTPHVGKLAGVVTVLFGGSCLVAAGFLMKRGFPWVFAAILVLILVIYLEGAYRVWERTDADRLVAEAKLQGAGTHEALVGYLDARLREIGALQSELEALSPLSSQTELRIRAAAESVGDLWQRIASELRVAAPEWVDYFLTNPEWFNGEMPEPPSPELLSRLLDHTTEQLQHINEALRQETSSLYGRASP